MYHWLSLKPYQGKPTNKHASFTILIPFRNEENHLEKCLKSVFEQNYPAKNIEIIAINDHSTDQSVAVAENCGIQNSCFRVIHLDNKIGKKEALEKGISQAKYPWVITLDADCEVGQNWLKKINQYIQNTNKEYLVLPVVFHREKTLFDRLQSLDFLSLVASSAACIQGKKPLMSNGANTVFSKELFAKANGFEGNKHISSGDDVFLLHKIQKLKNDAIGYLHHQEVIAYTLPVKSLRQFIQQRVRWGSKMSAYQSVYSKAIAGIIMTVNIMLLVTFVLAIGHYISWKNWIFLFLTKAFFDLLFVGLSTPFYGKEKLRFLGPILVILYPIYIFVISLLGMVYRPKWKERKINSGQ